MFEPKKSLGLLHPEMRKRVRKWLELCQSAGLNVRITETRRTKARQFWLYCKGRAVDKETEIAYLGYEDKNIKSRPKEKCVTWTLNSKHIEGLAIDFGFVINGEFRYDGDWDKAYDLAEECGLLSLYRKYKKDRPHLELDPAFKE